VAELEASLTAELDLDECRRMLRRDPGTLRFAEFADLARRRGKLTEAAAICARGLLRHPHYATGRVVMGEIFWDEKLEENAEQEWREALRIDPRHPRAHLRLGQVHLKRGDLAQAKAAFEAAVVANPDLEEARELLAQVGGAPVVDSKAVAAVVAAARPRLAPAWLTVARCGELIAAVEASPSVESAVLADADGLAVAGCVASASDPEAGAAVAVELARELRQIAVHVGGGRLKAALVRGRRGSLRCVALEKLTLVAAIRPEAPLGAATAQIEEAIASVAEAGRER